ncbi:hypothetical protein E1295_40775 [Nonomuraea mesophila]|uniref:SH3 domain-containing protein n=1 Tax=Nonomuraea mesophila TaxID=2530382 RepID=A0A4R5EC02_9ACTN|nr:hypothetical protein [Nonomuraea mesophila]TDE30795.1 hypothetical protein E1295_40775 [Nonomuraea mesophila]
MHKTIRTTALALVAAAALPLAAAALPLAAVPAQAVVAEDTAQRAVRFDFRVPGVRIFARPDGRSTRHGLGYPGQGFEVDGFAAGTPYTCDNGVTTSDWEHGRNVATGVVGWVPSCNTVA